MLILDISNDTDECSVHGHTFITRQPVRNSFLCEVHLWHSCGEIYELRSLSCESTPLVELLKSASFSSHGIAQASITPVCHSILIHTSIPIKVSIQYVNAQRLEWKQALSFIISAVGSHLDLINSCLEINLLRFSPCLLLLLGQVPVQVLLPRLGQVQALVPASSLGGPSASSRLGDGCCGIRDICVKSKAFFDSDGYHQAAIKLRAASLIPSPPLSSLLPGAE
jgi:hypothetical protein